ncbi:MAG TPA: GTP-binding protein [Bacteroidales bacterium]|nr:GTP-binding protein [Bacteroidales bacterium]HPS16329.1 GTP-binding protein [Bacteroidales bacterium]
MEKQLQISFDTSAGQAMSIPCIGVFGRKNYGKSSFINALSGVELAEVSKISGTTKEPQKYLCELKDIGKVILFDTSGIDDYGEAGEKRIQKSMQVLKVIDFAVLIITGNLFAEPEKKMVNHFIDYALPFIVVHNKSDINELAQVYKTQVETAYQTNVIEFSSTEKSNVSNVINTIKQLLPESAYESKSMLGSVVSKNDIVVLAIPSNLKEPDGQLSKSHNEIARDLIDNLCFVLMVKETELQTIFSTLYDALRMTIIPTSSFNKAMDLLPYNTQLTTYGVVMARHKGNFNAYLKYTPVISELKDGDQVLIIQASGDSTSSEYKEPELVINQLDAFCEKKLEYHIVNLSEKLPDDYSQVRLVVLCGSIVLTKKQVNRIIEQFINDGVPITSFDMLNAYTRGIYTRAISPFIKK